MVANWPFQPGTVAVGVPPGTVSVGVSLETVSVWVPPRMVTVGCPPGDGVSGGLPGDGVSGGPPGDGDSVSVGPPEDGDSRVSPRGQWQWVSTGDSRIGMSGRILSCCCGLLRPRSPVRVQNPVTGGYGVDSSVQGGRPHGAHTVGLALR